MEREKVMAKVRVGVGVGVGFGDGEGEGEVWEMEKLWEMVLILHYV